MAAQFCAGIGFVVSVTFIVSLALTMAGRYYPTRPAKMMGHMTLTCGCAQILDPAVMGVGLLLLCAWRVIGRRA